MTILACIVWEGVRVRVSLMGRCSVYDALPKHFKKTMTDLWMIYEGSTL